ncbi:MAG: class I SAM-dependent RNA methyltransferase [Microbacteriaceae bacterium]|jgi:tRNA/tmRNA/rRNA uracil-C5-methylase (TrmA/RlmC/RlmD family)|nr:class I SAM-dependent RNA methyltransferase [Microbacteriaceae bacterium]
MATHELEITTMAHGGSGIGRLDGRVVFCPGVIPGEVVEVEIVEDSKKSLWRAQPLRIVSASPHRISHIWPEADISRPWATRAGGADYGHIELSHQRTLKTEILRDALRRFGGLSGNLVDTVEVHAAPGDDEVGGLAWRTRVSLHATEAGKLGPYAEKSHTVIPVRSLPLATENIQNSGVLDSSYEGASSVRVVDALSGIRLIIDNQKPQDLSEFVNGVEFRLNDHTFWQVHHQAPAVLQGAIARAVDKDRLDPSAPNADLYAGVGLLGSALADIAGTTLTLNAVESEESALPYLIENLGDKSSLNPVADRVDRWLRREAQYLNAESASAWSRATVILDPPRSGAKTDVINSLEKLRPTQIVYVACDPVALGRDTGLLTAAGYDMVGMEAWDLFPHTHHMETIATFLRR